MGNEVRIITNKAGHKVEMTKVDGNTVAKEYDKTGKLLKQSVFEQPRTDAGLGGFATSQTTTTTLAKDGKLDNSVRYSEIHSTVLPKTEYIVENDNTKIRKYFNIGEKGNETKTEKM